MKQKSYSPSLTIKKALSLLEILGKKQCMRPTEIIQELNFTRSNVYRLLSTLENQGYVERTLDSKYRLSYKIFVIGSTVPKGNQLVDAARPYMMKLAEISKENINLAVMYDSQVLYVDKILTPHYLKLDQPIGKMDPLHCTALGKVLLSGLDGQEWEQFFRSNRLTANTKGTITDPKVLGAALQEVRKQGWAVDLEELSEGIHCIGAPLRGYGNKTVAAISISGPSMRLTRNRIRRLKAPLIDAAREISMRLVQTHQSIFP